MDAELLTPIKEADIEKMISLDDIRADMRLASTQEDDLLKSYRRAAVEYLDGPSGWLRRAVLPQKWAIYYNCLSAVVELPFPPLVTVESVGYRDDSDIWQTIPTSAYETANGTLFGQVYLAYDHAWPSFTKRRRGVKVVFTAGYDPNVGQDDVRAVPTGIKQAARLLIGSLYNNREATFEDTRISFVSRKTEFGLEALAGRYRIANDLVDEFI